MRSDASALRVRVRRPSRALPDRAGTAGRSRGRGCTRSGRRAAPPPRVTAAAPRAFSPSKPMARTLTAGDRNAATSPSIDAVSSAGVRAASLLRRDRGRSRRTRRRPGPRGTRRWDRSSRSRRGRRRRRRRCRRDGTTSRSRRSPSCGPPEKSVPAYRSSRLEVMKSRRSRRKPAPSRTRLVGEDRVASGLGGEERAAPRLAERAVLVEHRTGRRAAAVDVARWCRCRGRPAAIRPSAPPAGPTVGLPRPLAIVGGEAEVGVLHHPAHAARGRVVVVALEDVAERRDRLLVAVAEVVPDDLRPACRRGSSGP